MGETDATFSERCKKEIERLERGCKAGIFSEETASAALSLALQAKGVEALESIAESLKGLLQEFQRPAEEQLAEVRQCPVCGGEFVPTQKDQEYCDEECKNDQEP